METKNDNKIVIDPTIKYVFKVLADIFKSFPKYIYILVIFILFGYFYLKNKEKGVKPIYSGTLTFVLSKDEIGEGGELPMSVLSELGISNNTYSSAVTTVKINELLQTKRVIFSILFQEIEINNKNDYVANHFLKIQYDQFGHSSPIDSSYFKNVTRISDFNRSQMRMFNIIHSKFTSIYKISISQTGMYTLKVQSNNEAFTFEMCNLIFNSLTSYFTNLTIQKAQLTYDFIDNRLDSLSNELIRAENILASWRDNNANLIRSRGFLEEERLNRNVSQLRSRYLQTVSRHEAARLKLDYITPLFQIVDPPYYPLQNINKIDMSSSYTFMIIGCLALYILIITIIYFYKTYKHIIKDIFNEIRSD